MYYDAIVLGGGAAGLMCAIEAGKRGRRVAVLEHAGRIGKKILISGGGRCNFTNIYCRPENFLSANPHFHKSALSRYTPKDFIRFVEKHRIPYHEKKLGQLFCNGSAGEIISMLEREATDAGVKIVLDCKVRHVRRNTKFIVETAEGDFTSSAIVVATGGLSIPKIGATDFGYRIARQFGLRVIPTRPALVPLTLAEADCRRWCDLAGVSADVLASFGKIDFREKMLFTHRGLSGPAILQISSYWDGRAPIRLDLVPGIDLQREIEQRRKAGDQAAIKTILSRYLPKRLAERLMEEFYGDLGALHHWTITPAGTEGYAKAEVTAGGVDTDGLSSKTMEARQQPGLFFIGEVVDVTGHLGGFNFQWAWASGYAAGQAL